MNLYHMGTGSKTHRNLFWKYMYHSLTGTGHIPVYFNPNTIVRDHERIIIKIDTLTSLNLTSWKMSSLPEGISGSKYQQCPDMLVLQVPCVARMV